MSKMTKTFLYKGDNNKVLENGVNFSPNIIYMDPPYNTWNSSLLYEDSKNGNDWKKEFERLLTNINDIAQDNSVFFISIGVEELANVMNVVRDILGKKSMISVMPRRTHSGHKTTKTISLQHDFVVVAKKGLIEFEGIDFVLDSYNKEDEHLNKRGKHQLRRVDYKEFKWSESLDFPVEINGEIFYPGNVSESEWKKRKNNHYTKDWSWIWSKEKIAFAIENDFIEVVNGKLFKKTYTKAQIKKISPGKYEVETIQRTKKIDSLNFIDQAYALKKSKNHPEMLFDYPKSDELIIDLIKLPKFKEKIILDPFGGTGTTAVAANIINAKEVHIIQIDEKTSKESQAYKKGYKSIYDLTKRNIEERIKKEVIEK